MLPSRLLELGSSGQETPREKKGECSMEHLRVATYEIKTGNFQDVAEKARHGMLKTFSTQPGFIRYGLADLGDKRCLSISFWATHEDANAAVPVSPTWVRENPVD